MDLSTFTPDQISAFWAGVTGVTAVVTGVVAIATLIALRQDSRDRSRRVVAADLLPVVLSHGTSELVIRNVGASVARNVRVSFSPDITEETGQMAGYLARRYSQPITTMGPGRRLSNLYSHWKGDGSLELADPVPFDLTVAITYNDTHGRHYADSYELSMSSLRNETTTSPSNTDEKGMPPTRTSTRGNRSRRPPMNTRSERKSPHHDAEFLPSGQALVVAPYRCWAA